MLVDFRGHNEDRLRRAKSWLEEAQMEGRSDVEAFLFFWIAFNAAYGGLPDTTSNEWTSFTDFAAKIIELDNEGTIQQALTKRSVSIKALIGNKYIYRHFWEFIRGDSIGYWEKEFSKDNQSVWKNWQRGNTAAMLNEVLSRLYTLRNQVAHGGVTYGAESLGKEQLTSGRNILAFLIPLILQVMEDSIHNEPATEIWGVVAYPRYKEHN